MVNFALALSLAACRSEPVPRTAPVVDLPAGGAVTIALAGDTSFTTLDGVSSNALDLVRGATLAFTNLEVTLLNADRVRDAENRPTPRWIFAPARDAARLRDAGFDVVSLANNHAMDFGADGLRSTLRALDGAGIVHAGAGADLAAARGPAVVGHSSRHVAVVAVTASLSDQARASASQQDIQGRPGVSPLAYDATVTVDAATFRTLAGSVTSLQAGPSPGEHEFTMFGRRIRKGDETRVEFTLTASDAQSVLAAIRAARQQAEFVIVSLHSHEPVNESEAPADFIRDFAHAAVDAGAHLVVGHGPHRLRGAEIYQGAPIFYSLGNFVFETNGLDFRAADQFDAGSNLYTAALGASAAVPSPYAQLDRDWWWQGALVMATEESGTLTGVRVYPVTLKSGDEPGKKGVPQLAARAEAGTILRQFSDFSRRFGTDLPVGPSTAILELPISENR